MIYLIIFFTICFFILAWRRLDWALMFLIAALPSYLIRFNFFGLPSTLLEAMIWAVFLAWFLKNRGHIIENCKLKIGHLLKIENSKLKIDNRYPFDWEIVLWLILALMAAGMSGFSAASLGIWKAYFFEPALLFIVIINTNQTNRERTERNYLSLEKILWPLAISALAVSLLAIYQKFTGQYIDNPVWAAASIRRVVSFFGYPNAVGLYLAPMVLVMTGWLCGTAKNFQFSIFNFQSIFNVKIFKPALITSVVILSVLSVYFARSKGALIGVTAGLVMFGLLAGRKIRWTTIIVLIVASLAVAAYQPARDLAMRNVKMTNLSGQIRKAGWSDTWRMLKDGKLLTGAGLANFQKTVASYHTEGIFYKDPSDPGAQRKLVFNEAYRTAHWQPLEIFLYPHNILLNFWSEIGLAGVLLFIWIILKYFGLGISTLVIAAPEPQSRNMNETKIWIPGQARNDRKEWKFFNIGLICAMVVILVHGLVDVPYFKNDLAVMFWLYVAMMSLVNLETKYGIANRRKNIV